MSANAEDLAASSEELLAAATETALSIKEVAERGQGTAAR